MKLSLSPCHESKSVAVVSDASQQHIPPSLDLDVVFGRVQDVERMNVVE
jgi:hypothetical protein